jgi:hypothetical protein
MLARWFPPLETELVLFFDVGFSKEASRKLRPTIGDDVARIKEARQAFRVAVTVMGMQPGHNVIAPARGGTSVILVRARRLRAFGGEKRLWPSCRTSRPRKLPS